jgi:GNAT superfamily N-acetyltransferase
MEETETSEPPNLVSADPHVPLEFFFGHPLFVVEESRIGPQFRLLLYESDQAIKRPVGKIILNLRPTRLHAVAHDVGAPLVLGESCHVDNLWVAEAARGLGFGRVLLHQAMAAAAELGVRHITLDAEEDTRKYRTKREMGRGSLLFPCRTDPLKHSLRLSPCLVPRHNHLVGFYESEGFRQVRVWSVRGVVQPSPSPSPS